MSIFRHKPMPTEYGMINLFADQLDDAQAGERKAYQALILVCREMQRLSPEGKYSSPHYWLERAEKELK